jgi:Domain of unknown function (DUF4124)
LEDLRPVFSALMVLGLIAAVAPWADAKPSRDSADAPIYRYTDREGRTVFTNDLEGLPADLRSSAEAVDLPPAVTMAEPAPPPPPGLATRIHRWFVRQPTEFRLVLVGVLPPLLLSLWVLHYLRKRAESLFLKTSLRVAMLAVVAVSAYLCYFLFVRYEASHMSVTVLDETPGGISPRQKAEELKKDEADRLKTIENIADPQ